MTRASEDEVLITRLLEKSIRRTEAVDREALCIVAGEKVRLSRPRLGRPEQEENSRL
jgi:exosome complex RNA-binding protein Rrp42 (RNase PH superfamily)